MKEIGGRRPMLPPVTAGTVSAQFGGVAKETSPRSALEKTAARVERRLKEIEDLARANRRELDIQFRRISAIQEQLDRLSAAIGKS
jgi:hypothetical protein